MESDEKKLAERLQENVRKEKLPIKPELDHHYFYVRFLRARKQVFDDAWTMLKESLLWRAEKKVDEVDKWFAESEAGKEIIAYWPNHQMGISTKGGFEKLVLAENITLVDPADCLDRFSGDDLINFHIWLMERELKHSMERSKEQNKDLVQVAMIENVDGLSWSHLNSQAMDLLKQCFALDEKHYPEVLGAFMFINCPGLFTFVWKLLSPFVDENTLSKVKVCGGDWMKQVEEVVGADFIPSEWGGKSVVELFRFGSDQVDSSAGDLTEITVSAGQTHYHEFQVEKDGSSIVWSFETKNYDIGFSVVRKDKKDKILQKPLRVESHKEPCGGSLGGLKKGTHALVFDNTYSWTTAKEVSLNLNVRGPMSKSQKKRERKKRNQEKKNAKK